MHGWYVGSEKKKCAKENVQIFSQSDTFQLMDSIRLSFILRLIHTPVTTGRQESTDMSSL